MNVRDDFFCKAPEAGPGDLAGLSLDEIEYLAIMQTIAAFNGNRSAAARSLNVSIRTIRNKLNGYRSRGWLEGRRISLETSQAQSRSQR